MPPPFTNTIDLSNLALETDVSPTRGSDQQQRHKSPGTTSERRSIGPEQLRPLPESLLFDIRNVQAMTDIKTHIGYARAWVRLALEKKLLSRHLKTLLSNQALLRRVTDLLAHNHLLLSHLKFFNCLFLQYAINWT